MSARLDFADKAAVRAWLADLATQLDEIDALVTDMLAPPDARELGPVLHAAKYAEVSGALSNVLDYAGAYDKAPPEPSDDSDVPPWEQGGAS